jgi:hypothetical protein
VITLSKARLLTTAVALVLAACGVKAPPESVFAARDFGGPVAQPCADRQPLRRALWGDLHVHTSYSSDAWGFGLRLMPEDAYRYAFGDTVHLPLEGDPFARPVRIDRPLDFAAVTDHAEFLGEQGVCLDPDSPGYDSDFCKVERSGEGRAPAKIMRIMSPFSTRDKDTCGDDGARCARYLDEAWQAIVDAAQVHNDTSENCEHTAFVAYEYSSFRLGSNLHRNVIFRNSVVPARPISYLDVHREWDLWRILQERCIDSGLGCDAVAIPHNSNISNGRMFAVDYPGIGSPEEQAQRAALRARLEPVVEIMQHKGDSECRNGLEGVLGGVDELCDFEKFETLAFESTVGKDEDVGTCYDGPMADWVPHLGPNCLDRNSYVRYALIEGLREQQRIGVNPYKFGLSASTDTHNGIPGAVDERSFPGHLGLGDATPAQRVQFDPAIPGNANNGPGGLIGVWAEENSRDSIFDALQRREVFGTSGPRIVPRFFGGWEYAANLCDSADMLEQAYAGGVPMGADLPEQAAGAPRFLVAATADAGTEASPGTPLQRLQVVKGWADSEGNHHQRVFDVAGNPDNGASVDPASCAPQGQGYAQLCAVWEDPAFDESIAAVYYLRAVENPSCRFTAHQCLQLPEGERPADCAAPRIDPVIQERAWSSPIWYTPTG